MLQPDDIESQPSPQWWSKLADKSSIGPRLSETADIVQYNAVMRGGSHPRSLMRFYREHGIILFKPLSSNMDTPFHVAAFFGDIHLLQVLLRIAATYSRPDFADMSERICKISNYEQNNILHGVAASGEVKVLELLTKRIGAQQRAFLLPDQIKHLIVQKNDLGETPFYKASALAGQKMLRCMIRKAGLDITHHLYNTKNQTILEIAILGKNFGSAVWLLNEGYLDEIFENDKNVDIKCLRMLAKMPHAFESGYAMGIWHALIYKLLPVDIMKYTNQWHYAIVPWVYYALCLFIAKVIWPIPGVWEKKKTYAEAVKLLNLVLEKGKSWKNILSPTEGGENHEFKYKEGEKHEFDPLLLAASKGIVEMVRAILNGHPIAIDNSDDPMGWNLLHVAVAYRRENIFSLLTEEWALPMKKLVTKIMPESKYTVLHQVADNRYCSNTEHGMQFGPALQLQDELRWLERVENITPNTILFNEDSEDKTAKELFAEKHTELHQSAKDWLKGTTSNCSTVAVLIAGVAFAGACTVPGDYNEKGYPHFLTTTLYKIFTTSVVVALTSSLVSVVVFLSILTSPLPMRSFRHSLPQKLMWGFAALFVSVISTMLAFMAAVMLVIGLKRKEWTTSLAYTTVFLPVLIMGIVQFPLVYLLERLVKPAVSKAAKKIVYHVTSFLIHFHDIKDSLLQKKNN